MYVDTQIFGINVLERFFVFAQEARSQQSREMRVWPTTWDTNIWEKYSFIVPENAANTQEVASCEHLVLKEERELVGTGGKHQNKSAFLHYDQPTIHHQHT